MGRLSVDSKTKEDMLMADANKVSDRDREEWNMKNWRSWGSWFSWGSPVGLGLFVLLVSISVWILTHH
jgi:hypothetical protein